MVSLVLVLGDQLSEGLSALKAADKSSDVVVMAEVRNEATYVPHHPKKIALIFAAMRKFADRLRTLGWTVDYTAYDATEPAASIREALLRASQSHGAGQMIATRPGEFRLIAELEEIGVRLLEDDRFIASHSEFEEWASGRKQLRMEYFYRQMRRKTGLLMDGDKPEGGRWNFDHDNRKPPAKGMEFPKRLRTQPDDVTRAVIDLVAREFPDNFGTLEPFWFATDADGAHACLSDFLDHCLPIFGDYQDAMLADQKFLYHGLISFYLNIGLLDPLDVCRQAEAAYESGHAPLNAVEGFIRQILGWREYIRGIYFHEGPDYTARNGLGHTRALPAFFWGAPTRMNCISKAVAQTRDEAYAHHIQRLMVTGNFALLAGVDPSEVHEWYLAVYADAFEWVEAPNTIGMSQFADGGVVASKPYVSSGAYINRMSDYCKGCSYSVTIKTGDKACPFNLLYWDFLMRHREKFQGNPRMAQMYRTWERMDETRREAVLRDAGRWLKRLDAGDVV